MADFIWLVCLVITHSIAYYIGRNDAIAMQPTKEAWLEVKRYEIDKRFEHMRWMAERKDDHEE